jgi:hypothetical protein
MDEQQPRKRRLRKPPDPRRAEIIRWLETGLPIETAARMADIRPSDLEDWRARSMRLEAGWESFEDDVQKALARGEGVHLARIAEAGRSNWRASAWLLERMYPEKYAPPLPIAHDATTDETTINDFTGL